MSNGNPEFKRQRLPNRRLSLTVVVKWSGDDWLLGVGFDRQGQAREVFLSWVKVGSDTEAILDDACVVISILLQGGMAADTLAGHLGREGTPPPGALRTARYASPIGMLAASIAYIERTDGQGIREAYKALDARRLVPS